MLSHNNLGALNSKMHSPEIILALQKNYFVSFRLPASSRAFDHAHRDSAVSQNNEIFMKQMIQLREENFGGSLS